MVPELAAATVKGISQESDHVSSSEMCVDHTKRLIPHIHTHTHKETGKQKITTAKYEIWREKKKYEIWFRFQLALFEKTYILGEM